MEAAGMLERMIASQLGALDPARRKMLAALAVFPPAPNSFSESAARAVADQECRLLDSLAAAGFLEHPAPTRYAIRKEVAELAAKEVPDPAAASRFVTHFAGYADIHRTELSVLDAEYTNLLGALTLARSVFYPGFPAMVLNLGGLFELRGNYALWKELLLKAKGMAGRSGPLLTALLLHLARVCEKLGDNEAALNYARSGLETGGGERGDIAELLALCGHVEMNRGLLQEARTHLMSGLALAEEMRNTEGRIQCLASLGVVLTRLGDYEAAVRYTNQGMDLARASNNPGALATLLTNLGVLLYHQSRFEEAIRVDEEGLAIAVQIGYSEKQAALLQAMGGALIRLGDLSRAQECLQRALEIARRIEHRWYIATILNGLGHLFQEQDRLGDAVATFQEAIRECPPGSPDVQGYSFFGLAGALLKAGDTEPAREAALKALHIFDDMGHHAAAEVRNWMGSIAGWGPPPPRARI